MDFLLLFAQASVEAADIPWWERVLDKYGFGGFAMLLSGFVIWQIAKQTPRVGNVLVDYLITSKDAVEKTARATEVNSRVNEQLSASIKHVQDALVVKLDPKGDPKYDYHAFSTVQTNRALTYLSDALLEIANDHPAKERVVPHIQRAIDALKRTRLS